MASYSLNARAVAKARQLIDARQYVLDRNWGEFNQTRTPHDLLQHLNKTSA